MAGVSWAAHRLFAARRGGAGRPREIGALPVVRGGERGAVSPDRPTSAVADRRWTVRILPDAPRHSAVAGDGLRGRRGGDRATLHRARDKELAAPTIRDQPPS